GSNMRVMPLAVGALCMVLGMCVVWFFGHKPHKKPKHTHTPAVSACIEMEPSRRVVIYPSEKPGGSPKIVSQTPDSTVDVRWANLNSEAIAALDKGQNEHAVELFEQCHVAVPTEKVFTSNLAEALARLSTNEYDAGSQLD